MNATVTSNPRHVMTPAQESLVKRIRGHRANQMALQRLQQIGAEKTHLMPLMQLAMESAPGNPELRQKVLALSVEPETIQLLMLASDLEAASNSVSSVPEPKRQQALEQAELRVRLLSDPAQPEASEPFDPPSHDG